MTVSEYAAQYCTISTTLVVIPFSIRLIYYATNTQYKCISIGIQVDCHFFADSDQLFHLFIDKFEVVILLQKSPLHVGMEEDVKAIPETFRGNEEKRQKFLLLRVGVRNSDGVTLNSDVTPSLFFL